MKTFRELTVWQQAHELVLGIYRATTTFPSHERYGLVSQMRRSATSIAANIVEGHKRKGRKEFLNFLNMADGSLEELKYYLIVAKDLNYLVPTAMEPLHTQTEVVGRMLGGLKRHVQRQVLDAIPLRT